MAESPSRVAVSRRLPHFESLEDRRLLSLVVDVRLAGGGSSAAITKVGQVINLEVWATATGSNSTGSDEGVQNLAGSYVSSNSNGGSALGTLKATLLAPFDGSGSTAGKQQDVDGDGDLDV